MKNIILLKTLIIGLGFLMFSSCTKEKAVTTVVINQTLPPPTLKPDTSLGTKEIVFKDLTWDFDNDGGATLYIGIENLDDLFGNSVVVAVYLKSDHDTAWVAAEKFQYPNSPGYVYSVYSNSLFVFHSPHIFPWSDYNHLAGTIVSIKVKLL